MCDRFDAEYQEQCKQETQAVDVAVRSSATAEDLPDASFAGQQETYLNVFGVQDVIDSCHRCFASIFTDRAISYRTIKGFDHFNVALSVGVQKMVRSDLASSGVMFSIDTETGFKNAALVTAAYGLGENVVQGAVNPDEYFVFKPTLKQGYRPILEKRLGSKEIKIPMIPFCRTPDEGRKVLAEMEKHGLKRGENGLQVYVMCEIPSNVILADQFSEVFDGFSIGSNDLTQLTLGLDRDSALVAHIFDERNEGVKEMVRMVIEKAKKNKRV